MIMHVVNLLVSHIDIKQLKIFFGHLSAAQEQLIKSWIYTEKNMYTRKPFYSWTPDWSQNPYNYI